MVKLSIKIGEKVVFNGREAVIIKIVDLDQVCIEEVKNNIIHTVKVKDLQPYNSVTFSELPEISLVSEKQWLKASDRFDIIRPILDRRGDSEFIKEVAKANNIHYTTIYRWLKKYEQTELKTALADKPKLGGKGKSRLEPIVEEVVKEKIYEIYLDSSKKSVNKVVRSIIEVCRERGINPPHSNTVRNRIKSISEEQLIRSRYGKSKARDKFEPHKGHFPGANYPLAVVQVDHTRLDIVLVDEHHRQPFLRPWLTLAVDVYSRMVVGFYLSFDPPGAMGTGLCVANSILPKENWLQRHDIDIDWPCWGVMATLHLDNAREFRGEMLERACKNYGINIEFRPVATPHFGGHIERLLGTFSKEIHNLAGTTFNTKEKRENYNSEKKAALTIKELEKWLLTFITKVYHQRIHSSIGISPLQKYKEGIFGNAIQKGVGLQPRFFDERRVRLDFMPFVERTIQEYGVVIDHVFYYDEVLRRYIHTRADHSKNSNKRKFLFRRDPRDISIVYFYDPEINEYYDIPYRDASRPPMSIWEFNEVLKRLEIQKLPIDEAAIFDAYKEMDEIERKSIDNTRRLKRTSRKSDQRNQQIHEKKEINSDPVQVERIKSTVDIQPFDDITDGTFI